MGAMQSFLDRYILPRGQQKTLEELMMQCHLDMNGVFRVLLIMGTCLDPHGLPEHAAIMAPIHQLRVHLLSRQLIPRAIEDHQAQDAVIRISRM